MSNFDNIKKIREFVQDVSKYSGEEKLKKSISRTFPIDSRSDDIFYTLKKSDMVSKVSILRAALLHFSKLPEEERRKMYQEVIF